MIYGTPFVRGRFLFRSATKIQSTARGHLGRKRFNTLRLESDKMARIELETFEVVKIQASLVSV